MFDPAVPNLALPESGVLIMLIKWVCFFLWFS